MSSTNNLVDIFRALFGDPAEAARRGALGRAAIEREWSWERESHELLACYARLARAAGRAEPVRSGSPETRPTA